MNEKLKKTLMKHFDSDFTAAKNAHRFMEAVFELLGDSNLLNFSFHDGLMYLDGTEKCLEVDFIYSPTGSLVDAVYVEIEPYSHEARVNQENIKTADPNELVDLILKEYREKVARRAA